MEGYQLTIKLDNVESIVSRTLSVPDSLRFKDLDYVFREIFDLSVFHLSEFHFDGFKTPLWDYTKTSPERNYMGMDVYIKDYLTVFKKFYWEYNLSKGLYFTVKVKKLKKVESYPVVTSYQCDYNLLDYRDYYDTDYLLLNEDYEEFTKFDLEEVNKRFKKL